MVCLLGVLTRSEADIILKNEINWGKGQMVI